MFRVVMAAEDFPLFQIERLADERQKNRARHRDEAAKE
jgi:hypothetical protein